MNKNIFCFRIFTVFIIITGCFVLFNRETFISHAISNPWMSYSAHGGGYAASGQILNVSYSTEVYDEKNGLSTSDAMFILGARNGYVWIGGYSGVIRYDGSFFEHIDTIEGLTSARGIFEDSKGRIWIGTNDNGVVMVNGEESIHFTYKDGLPSSSIRIFAEDKKGNIFIGTTAGVCYVDPSNKINTFPDNVISSERVLKLDVDASGKIFGQTSNGIIFTIEDCNIKEIYDSESLGMAKITSLLVDPYQNGMIYLGTEDSNVYYGKFGENAENMKMISVSPLSGVHWMNFDCGKIWVSSTNLIGYIDGNRKFVVLDNIPIDSGIEMATSDYQGNIWVASSTQGVMKIVTNNFIDVTKESELPNEVVNATYIYHNNVYIGADNGLRILGKNNEVIENDLTRYLDGARIRSFTEDKQGRLWIATYTNEVGLVCYDTNGDIISFNTQNGMPSDQDRCLFVSQDGSILVGSNKGLSIIKDGVIVRNVGSEEGIKNTVFLTVIETNEGLLLAGSDGDGIYVIDGDDISKLGRDDGLTSDVVVRLIKDDVRQVIWIITSNSIEYIKSGVIKQIKSFPYNNNYDMFLDDNGNAWVLSSYGVVMVDSDELIDDAITDYRLYTIENGLPYAITSNSFSTKDDRGNLYLPGRNGVVKVNINNFFEENDELILDVKSIYCDKENIVKDRNGIYQIPSSKGRIQITPSVMDYTKKNPTVRVFLEGGPDEGETCLRSKLSPLEYTDLDYGKYILHIQVLNVVTKEVLQDQIFEIRKAPRLFELMIIKIVIIVLIILAAGFIVWWVMRSTVINKQYDEIRHAKEDAERANTAKTRFLANISHEIRTPINTIMGMNEMILREDATNVPKRYFMSMMNYAFDIRNASESLLGLINDLLDMSKIESGKMHLVEQEYDTQEMLRSIVSMIRVRSTEKGLSFDVVIDELLPKRMFGDVGKIKQVVLNLLTNALKYTKVGGFCLSVSMDERQDDKAFLRFSVKDTGMGIKKEDMDKLFTAYERLDEEKNSAIQGTGLGLDISRKMAQLLGGQLWCESVYEEGSEFILTLTQTIEDENPIGAFIEHDESKASGPYVPKFIAPDADILVVDDNPMNLNVIKGLLKATKVFVTTSESGEDAIEKIKDAHFDVVLLDHMMPGLDGIETLARVRKFEPDIPVYALTANAVAGEDFYKSKGFNGYLSKPIDIETLEKTIMKHIPENKMEKASIEDAVEEITQLPENLGWLYETDKVSVSDGIRNSGGVSSFIFALNLFYDTIDENSKVIRDAYDNGNIRLYTIKVHALKSSARIIGADELSKLAEKLEDAGNKQDIDFIEANSEIFLSKYNDYKDILKGIKENDKKLEPKEQIASDELNEAYEALKDLIPQMDYDSVEMVLDSVDKYMLPDEDAKIFEELRKMLQSFDWDGMENLILK